jgi:tetratricopeptide (TPR) repeat protein
VFPGGIPLNRCVFSAISAAILFIRVAPAQQGQLDASPALFTVMAAINAAGYDADLDSPNNSPLRKAVRAEIAKRDVPSLARIKEFYAVHRKANDRDELGQYISFALCINPAPDFSLRKDADIPPEVTKMREFSHLLAAFYKEADIEDLWKRAQPGIDQLIAPYHEGVLNAVLQVNSYLRQPTSGFRGRHFQIFLEPLGAPGQMHTRSYGNEYTVVITPSPRPRIDEVRHAYLYYLLDPLATRNRDILERKKVLADHAERARLLSDDYKNDFLLLVTGSLVRAVEARMDHKPEAVQQALHEGYILTPYFSEALVEFEKQEQSMALYYASMVQAIDALKEDERLMPVVFASQAPAAPKMEAPQAKPVTPPIYETLNRAEELLKQHELEKSEALFQEAASQTANKRAQAAGYYGLGRIALVNGEAEAAESLLEQTLEADPEGQVRAWALVYLGKLRLEVNDKENATQYFQKVLLVNGASDAAIKEARQGLEKSLSK